MIEKVLARFVITLFIMTVLAMTYKLTQVVVIRGLRSAVPSQKEKQMKEKSKDLVRIMSKQVLYGTLFALSLIASLFADFLTQLCLVFTATVSFLEARSCSKIVDQSNQKLSRTLKAGLSKKKKR